MTRILRISIRTLAGFDSYPEAHRTKKGPRRLASVPLPFMKRWVFFSIYFLTERQEEEEEGLKKYLYKTATSLQSYP